MTVVAGIDVGNSTTEVVIARLGRDGIRVIATGRSPTRRAKGSPESLRGAAALVRRLETQHSVRVERAVVAPMRPVSTSAASLPEHRADTGRLWLAKAGATTAGGHGVGVGRPVRFGSACLGTDRVVVTVPRGTGYVAVADGVAPLIAAGRLAAVLVEDDEGVLVANRLGADVPVVDEVDVVALLAAEQVAVEVSVDDRPLQVLPDPLKLSVALGISGAEIDDAANLAPLLFDATNAVVVLGGVPDASTTCSGGWIDLHDAGRLPFLTGHQRLVVGRVGEVNAYALPPEESPCEVDDLWTVDLAAVASAVQARRGSARSRPVTLAALRRDAPYVDPAPVLSEQLAASVHVVSSEAEAAYVGGSSTPGARPDAVVVDLGGGTVDLVSSAAAVVAAGAGDLLTASVAALTEATSAAAEWVKRGPAHRVDAPQILLAEDGSRGFLDRPAPTETVGSLVVRGPAGLLPFSPTMAPGEWRALRLRLKVALVGGNVARALRTLEVTPRTVVVVGGSAGDEEILAAVGGALEPGTAVGRGNVGGVLGHRYAVAYGLLLLLVNEDGPGS